MKTTKITLIALALAVGTFTSCKKKKETVETPTVNVKSLTFNTNNSAWTLNNSEYNATLTIEDIDQNILSSGDVNVFWGDGTGSAWTAIPVTKNNIQCSYGIAIHTVKITMSSTIDNNPPLTNPGVQQFRVIVTKGAARIAHPDIDWSNYNEVKKTFHLAD